MVDQAKYLSGFYTIQIFLFVDKLCTLCDPPRRIRRRNILDLIPHETIIITMATTVSKVVRPQP